MKESDIYKNLKKLWPYYIERIEPKYKGGIPDVLVEKNGGGACFIELKLFEIQKNGKVKIKIRPSQYIWFKQYTGRALLLAWNGETHYVFEKENVQLIRNGIQNKNFKELASINYDNVKFVSHWIRTFISS